MLLGTKDDEDTPPRFPNMPGPQVADNRPSIAKKHTSDAVEMGGYRGFAYTDNTHARVGCVLHIAERQCDVLGCRD